MDDKLIFHLSRANHHLRTYMQRQMKSDDLQISPGQAGILFLLQKARVLKMSELGVLLEIDNSAVTRLIDRLERSGLVERRLNSRDRRQYLISSTAKGRDQTRRMQKIASQANKIIKQGFTDEEIEIFKKVLESFHGKFKKGE